MHILFGGETFPSARAMIADRLPDDQFSVWRERAVIPQVTGLDVLVPMMFKMDAAVMDALKPRLIQQVGSGLEGVDLAAARERHIPVAALPASGANADSVAEQVLMFMIALLRELPLAQANIRSGVLGAPQGRMLSGRTACLWGLGATALSLAQRLRPLGVTVLGITRDPHAAKIEEYGLESVYATADSAACLARSDFLIPCVRLSDATRGLIDAKAFAALPRGAYFVNAARGPLVDYQALYDALASGRLAGAALDVFWTEPIAPSDPILALPNVIATPHIAGVTDASYREIVDGFVANIQRFRRGEPLLNRAV